MFWLILGGLTIIFLIIYYIYNFHYEMNIIEYIVVPISITIFVFIISLFFLGFTSAICGAFTNNVEYNKTQEINITALKDNSNVYGSYFLFSGYEKEKLYYYYSAETKYGYKIDKIDASNAYIKYSNEQPKIEIYSPEFTNSIVEFFALAPIFNDLRYIIYVPENTITNEFVINLE